MKTTKRTIIKYIHKGIEKFLDIVENYPDFLIYEADLRSLIYMTLFNYRKVFREPFTDEEKIITNILHTEYDYGAGFYDIVVLDPKKLKKTSDLKSKPILAGFELKLAEDMSLKKVYENMEDDSYAFNNQKNSKSAEYGFVVFLNCPAENRDSDLKEFKKKLKTLKKRRKLKKVYFYYIEIPEKKNYVWISCV